MLRLARFAAVAASLSVALGAATPVAPPTPAALGFWRGWDVDTQLRSSVGWRENLAYSAFNPLDRAFWRGEAEVFALRSVTPHWDVVSFLSGDVLRYISAPAGVGGEQQWVGHLETRWKPVTFFRTALKADGFLQTAYLDPSQTEGVPLPPLWVRIRGGFATLAPRLSLPGGWTIEPLGQVRRIAYRGYAGGYDEVRPGVRLEWKRSDLLVLSAGVYTRTRRYADLPQSTAGNRPLKGTRLSLHQREGELRAASTFSAAGEWTVAATVGRLENRDRAQGFLDYDRDRTELSLSWAHEGWRVNATGESRRSRYLVQQVGSGMDRPHRVADNEDLTLRIERELSARWTLFAEQRWERSTSNAVDDSGPTPVHPFDYRVNTTQAGVQRSF